MKKLDNFKQQKLSEFIFKSCFLYCDTSDIPLNQGGSSEKILGSILGEVLRNFFTNLSVTDKNGSYGKVVREKFTGDVFIL